MTFDNPDNQKAIIELQKAAPRWLHNVGDKFNMGIVVFTTNNEVIYRNLKFFSHFDLPRDITSKNKQFDSWLQYLIKRGDFQENPSEEFSHKILVSLSGPSSETEFPFSTVTPPNGKILKLTKFLPSENLVALITEDVTEQTLSQESLEMALEMRRSGYFQYCMETDKLNVFSNHLKKILTPSEHRIIKSKGFRPLIHKDDIDDYVKDWANATTNGTEMDTTIRLQTENQGTLWIKCKARPQRIHAGNSTHITGFIEDITEEYKIQDELRKAQEKTENALKSKTLFLARISHEIRTPMNAVIGIADALIHHNSNPQITPKLELIQSSAGNILNTLGDTLKHSELESDTFSLDLKLGSPIKVIRNACALWTEKAKANNSTLNCHIDDNVPDEISYDQYRYEQCINNLLSNAIKFCEGGKIDVFSTMVKKDGKDRLIVAVKDTGIGMTEDQQSRIFEPFQQGDRSISRRFGGSGLGMNITKQIIQMMGGTISVKSEIGKGSIFALSLPIESEKPELETPTETLFDQIMDKSGPLDTPYQNLKILVADDNQTNHIVIKSLLGSMVAEIYTASDGKEVMDILKVQDIDIILMDIHMPVMDGIEATLAIRSSDQPWSDIMIIAVTADPQYQQQRLCLNIGMDYAVAKPVKLMQLLEGVDHVLDMKKNRGSIRKVS